MTRSTDLRPASISLDRARSAKLADALDVVPGVFFSDEVRDEGKAAA